MTSPPRSGRARIAILTALALALTFICPGSAFVPSTSTQHKLPLALSSPANVFGVSAPTRTPSTSLPMASSKAEGSSSAEDRLNARTCVRRFLTQRSVQSFMFLQSQCRDPHTVKWLEDFSGSRGLAQFYGTGALNITRFEDWDSFLLQMLEAPGDTIIVTARQRGRGQGSWIKNKLVSARPDKNPKKEKSQHWKASKPRKQRPMPPPGAHHLTRSAPTMQSSATPSRNSTVSGVADRPEKSHGRRARRNPYVKERIVEFRIDIDPLSVASRIVTVREQLAREWSEDLDVAIRGNDMILESYFSEAMDAREDETEFDREDETESDAKSNETSSTVDLTAPYSARPEGKEGKAVFDRDAMYLLQSYHPKFNDRAASPLRRDNFDLVLLLATQESVHRVLKELREGGEEQEVSFEWLRDFYIERVGKFFDGNQRSGRADDFLEELLLTPPSVKNTDDGKMGLIDPLFVAEKIIRTRGVVANEWKEIVTNVPKEHTELRKALLARQLQKTVYNEPVTEHIEIIEGGDFE